MNILTRTQQRPSDPTKKHSPPETAGRRWLAVGLFILGPGPALVALLGPLVADVIRFHASEEAVNQIVGGDVAGLVLVTPLSLLTGATRTG